MNTKPLLVGIVFLLLCQVCNGQYFGKRTGLGIQLGVGKAGFWEVYDGLQSYGVRSHIVYAGGVYASRFVGDKFEPSIGFFYEEKGYVFDEVSDHSAEYLTSHLLLRYFPIKNIGFHTIAGCYMGKLVKSEDEFNKFDWGAKIGLGYKFLVYKTYGVEVNAVTSIGFKHNLHTSDGKHLSHLLNIGFFKYFD